MKHTVIVYSESRNAGLSRAAKTHGTGLPHGSLCAHLKRRIEDDGVGGNGVGGSFDDGVVVVIGRVD
jgi:hypothetical protein